jgi:predicted nucleic acid-binding protein
MTRYLPDTNILINALNGKRGHKELLAALVVQGHRLTCCVITLSELFSGIRATDVIKSGRVRFRASLAANYPGNRTASGTLAA